MVESQVDPPERKRIVFDTWLSAIEFLGIFSWMKHSKLYGNVCGATQNKAGNVMVCSKIKLNRVCGVWLLGSILPQKKSKLGKAFRKNRSADAER